MFRKNNKNPHFLQKLANREISGNFIRQGKANSQNSSASKLFKTIPSRCVYQLNNVIDLPGNHVFMGTTRCGQFLLTYSFITHTARSTLSQRNKYQLHWWLFRPGRRAAKVAEVQLFADYAVTSILTIGIAQWPTVNQRLVVYGYCNNAEDYLEEDHRRYYLTITTLPSLDCRDCLTVAASFDEEDMAANWDSCVSFSCLKHGLTIHSLFDVTPPYPKFDFNISLKLNNSVVFNTVNFLHVLSFDFETPKPDRPTKNEHNIVTAEINHRVGQIMTTRYPKEFALPYDINEAFKSANPMAKHVMKPLLLPPTSQPQRTSSIFHSKEKSSRQWCNRIPNLAMKPVPIRTKVWRRSIIDQAEKVYAFEESEDGGCEPKFKWYRRKRLADKMYEFCSDEDDEDMENIRPPDKCGHKLPRYKYLSPTKVTVTPPKCDADSLTPFTKMIRKNESRYMMQNADCCKRLIQNNWKTDETRHDNNELNNASDSLKTNSCSVDENCCDIRHRDMVVPQKSNTVIVGNLIEICSDKQQQDSLKSKSNVGNLVEICSDKQQQDSLKSIPTIDAISCDIRHRDMVVPQKSNTVIVGNLVEICCDKQQQDSSKSIPPIDAISCDIRHRDMVVPQIPPKSNVGNLVEICSDKQQQDSSKSIPTIDAISCDIRDQDVVLTQIPSINVTKSNTTPEISNLPESSSDKQDMTSLKTNSSSNDTSCNTWHQDVVKTITIQSPSNDPLEIDNSSKLVEIGDKEQQEDVDSLRAISTSDNTSCDVRYRDMDKPEISNLPEFSSDKQDMTSLKTNSSSNDTSCNIGHQDMVKTITIQYPSNDPLKIDNPSKLVKISDKEQQEDETKEDVNSLRAISTSDNTSCDTRYRDMDKPVTIQIPPIDLPFCVASEKKQEPLLKEPEPLLKEPELLLKEPEPFFLSPATVNVKRVRSDIDNCDNRNVSSPPDTQSNPSSDAFKQVDTVTCTLKTVNRAKDAGLVDILSSEKIEIMETVESDNEKIAATVFSVSNPSSEINDIENVCCISNDTVSNPSSTNVCNSSKDSVSNASSTNPDVCNSSKDCESNSSPPNSDTKSNIDIVSHSAINSVPNSSSRYISRESVSSSATICNTPSDSVSNVKASFETNPRYTCRESVSSSATISNTPSDSVSNVKASFESNPRYTCRESVSSPATICNPPSDTVSNVKAAFETNPRYTCRESVSSSATICNPPSDTVSNVKATFETSNINHDVRAIIADWEADSISSMSPQSEFSSSVTTCNSPKVFDYALELAGDNCTERHMIIQRFLEIPPRFGCGAARKNCSSQHVNHHRCTNITSNDVGMKVLHHSNVTRCHPMRVSSTQYPPIKLRALQPHNRIRRSCFKPDSLSPPLCVKEEELKRKKMVGCVGANKNELGERRGFKHDLLLSPPLRFDKEEEGKRKKILGGGKPEGDRRKVPTNYSEFSDGFEVKRKREKVGGFSGGEVADVKRKKKDEPNSFEDDLADILDNIVDRRKISDCSIQLDRRFIEVDEEMISTITDIEDDDQAVGFHCALPLHVHGSAYAQMQMVSNQKVDKLNVPCVLVRQNSLDIEQLCFKAAEVICRCEGFKFWFCDDYDTEIVEVCTLDGSVLIVIFMRLNVEQENVCSKPVVVDRRHFYECKCLFVWSPGRQECLLETFTHLRPVPHDRELADGWSPARKEALRMRARAETGFFHLQPAPAIRAFVHRLYDDDDNQTDSALEVQDPTNLMLFRLYPVNSNMRINRNRIVVL